MFFLKYFSFYIRVIPPCFPIRTRTFGSVNIIWIMETIFTVMEWESKTSSLIVSYDHRGFSYSESFRSRASLFEDQISRGNGDLLLRGVKVDDEGRYRFVFYFDGNRITCSSEGIYPQPELTWSTEPPSNTTLQNRTTVHQTEEKLYDITVLLLSTDSSHWMLNHLHFARSRSNAPSWTSERVQIRSVPFLSSLSTVLAIIIIASLTTAPSENAFFFLIRKCVALNEASVAFSDFFPALVKKDCCLPKAAFSSLAFSARTALPGG
uniref:Butyrophilin subfamily 3 member A2-like Ig-C domain-containing protein n=1 Tax=Xiphophorus maculatus TaxID=8083 RepID=A0A3B5QQH6_XIPMA